MNTIYHTCIYIVVRVVVVTCHSLRNPTYQAFVTLQPDWLPFNSLGADVVNKRKYKTGKDSDLPHMI